MNEELKQSVIPEIDVNYDISLGEMVSLIRVTREAKMVILPKSLQPALIHRLRSDTTDKQRVPEQTRPFVIALRGLLTSEQKNTQENPLLEIDLSNGLDVHEDYVVVYLSNLIASQILKNVKEKKWGLNARMSWETARKLKGYQSGEIHPDSTARVLNSNTFERSIMQALYELGIEQPMIVFTGCSSVPQTKMAMLTAGLNRYALGEYKLSVVFVTEGQFATSVLPTSNLGRQTGEIGWVPGHDYSIIRYDQVAAMHPGQESD